MEKPAFIEENVMRFNCRVSRVVTGLSCFALMAGCASVQPAGLAQTASAESVTAPLEEAIIFTAHSGESVEAFQGSFSVPEIRTQPNSRMIEIGYVRFPALGERPGPPIIYLAGGPGGTGTGTAKGARFPLFMAMRQFGDVIAFDQRGTGLSDDTPECVSSIVIPQDRKLARKETVKLLKKSVTECDAFWKMNGVNMRGYTTVESARDIDALREHLGAKKISLWGISYGTHLALAAVKEMGARIDKMVLASAEGLAQTVKLPSQTDAYFDRLQSMIDKDAETKAVYPDIKGLIRRVHEKLDSNPVMLKLGSADEEHSDFLLHGDMMRMLASAFISDPERVGPLLQLYSAADAGFYDPVARILSQFITPGSPQSWHVMPLAMDIASGISNDRLARVTEESKTSLLSDYLNFPMPQLANSVEGLDLGDDFRAGPEGKMPVLLLTGTLDGRTYPAEQIDALNGFDHLSVVTVVHAGHNLFMTSPEVTQVIESFMRGEKIGSAEIILSAPSFLNN